MRSLRAAAVALRYADRVARRSLFFGLGIYKEPSRDFVFDMHVLLAAIAGVAAAMYLHLGWWSAAIAVGLAFVLELALRWRSTAWLSIAIGAAFAGGAGVVAGIGLAASLSNARSTWWALGIVGGAGGGAVMLAAHRKIGLLRREPS